MTNKNIRSVQEGAALFVSLVMLLLMTLIVLTGSRSSYLELVKATNTQNSMEALLRAEDSVMRGERRLAVNFPGAPTTNLSAVTSDGLYLDPEIAVGQVDWTGLAHESEGTGTSLREYVIEYIGPAPGVGGSLAAGAGVGSSVRYLYRVSGRGQSSRASARVVQTIFATVE